MPNSRRSRDTSAQSIVSAIKGLPEGFATSREIATYDQVQAVVSALLKIRPTPSNIQEIREAVLGFVSELIASRTAHTGEALDLAANLKLKSPDLVKLAAAEAAHSMYENDSISIKSIGKILAQNGQDGMRAVLEGIKQNSFAFVPVLKTFLEESPPNLSAPQELSDAIPALLDTLRGSNSVKSESSWDTLYAPSCLRAFGDTGLDGMLEAIQVHGSLEWKLIECLCQFPELEVLSKVIERVEDGIALPEENNLVEAFGHTLKQRVRSMLLEDPTSRGKAIAELDHWNDFLLERLETRPSSKERQSTLEALAAASEPLSSMRRYDNDFVEADIDDDRSSKQELRQAIRRHAGEKLLEIANDCSDPYQYAAVVRVFRNLADLQSYRLLSAIEETMRHGANQGRSMLEGQAFFTQILAESVGSSSDAKADIS